jgi:4-diphosphocytidyl-2-C-methyl-D-erythritol kinase
MEETAPGKINLALRVMRRRDDGYHEVDMVMQSISLADTVSFDEAPALALTTNDPSLSCDKGNLAYQAAVVFQKAAGITPCVHIHITKRIFMAAGLAGGSADAAAVLRGLNRFYGKPLSRQELESAAAEIGSDVPFCIAGGTQRAVGRGEKMKVLPAVPRLWLVLIKPADLGVSTAWVYGELDRLVSRHETNTDACVSAIAAHDRNALLEAMENDLEAVTLARYGQLRQMKKDLVSKGAEKALMSGSGPTLFGIVRDEAFAQRLSEAMHLLYPKAQIETACTKEEYYG